MTTSGDHQSQQNGTSTPTCIHVVGIGRTGAVYVEALLRTGEVEDLLTNSGATFAALAIDIGDDDMSLAQDYGASFTKRLESRGLPTDRYSFQSVALDMPSKEALFEGIAKTSQHLKLGDGKKFDPYLPPNIEMPKAGEHVPRAVAKGIYANAYYDGPLEAALTTFAAAVDKATLPSVVMVCFSLAGGTGSGMVVDLSRHLAEKLGKGVTIVGVGQLPHTGDPEVYKDSPALYTALNDIDCMLDQEKNAPIVAAYGETFRNPFNGGFFIVNPEQSWQRLTAYTTTGEARIRQAIKEMVTNRFVGDSFMRWCVADGGADLTRVLKPAEGPETAGGEARGWTMFNVAKLTHPGVQVLPGEAPSKWDAVISQWIGFTHKYDGLRDDFKTDLAEVSIFGSRNMGHEDMVELFKEMMKKEYLINADAKLPIFMHEFFDTLTAYANVILLGVSKTDLHAFWNSQKSYDQLTGGQKLAEHSWLVDVGPMLSDPTLRFEGLPVQCAENPVVPQDVIRGEKLSPTPTGAASAKGEAKKRPAAVA